MEIQKITTKQKAAIFLLDGAEKLFLKAFGWKRNGDGWDAPIGYHKSHVGINLGHAVNSQRQACGVWGKYNQAKSFVEEQKAKGR